MILTFKDIKRLEDDKFFKVNQHLNNLLKLPSFQPTIQFFQQTCMHLQSKLKSPELFYEQVLDYFLSLYLVFYSFEDKPSLNIYNIFSKVVNLPTELKQDIQKDWQEYYQCVRTLNQQSKQRKLVYLLKCAIIKFKSNTIQSKNKLPSLIKKAMERQFNPVGLPISIGYYFSLVFKSVIYGQSFEADVLCEGITQIVSKNGGCWQPIIYQLLSQNYETNNFISALFLGCLNLIRMYPKVYLTLVLESLKMNQNSINKFINTRSISILSDIHIDKLLQQVKNDKCSIWRALNIVYARTMLKLLEEDTRIFIQLIETTKQFFKNIPSLFELIIDSSLLYCLSHDLDLKKLSLDTNYGNIFSKYKHNTKILILVFQFYRFEQSFLDQLSNTLDQNSLKQFVREVTKIQLQQSLEKSQNNSITKVLIPLYLQEKHKGVYPIVMKLLVKICEKQSTQFKINQLKEIAKQLSKCVCFDTYRNSQDVETMSVVLVQQQLLHLYFQENLQIEVIVKLKSYLFLQEKHNLAFLNSVFKIMYSIQSSLTKEVKSQEDDNPITKLLLRQINISIIGQKQQPVTQQHPFIKMALELGQQLGMFLPSNSQIIKKIFKSYFDRPSEFIIETKILKNRFILRCAVEAQVSNILKSIYEIVQKMQNNQDYLKILFPRITDQKARQIYLKYLINKRVAEFRIERQQFPQFQHHMPQ